MQMRLQWRQGTRRLHVRDEAERQIRWNVLGIPSSAKRKEGTDQMLQDVAE